ncbi:MAG: hypothetical protein DRP47_07085 [Candidatus Zixiibacteriota bacterium]|nr:MAG: hypothetical protein DRP47_07085 [candidate division Zixibacteria bacterium]
MDPQWICCCGLAGNIDYDRWDDVNVSDLTFFVSYMFTGGPEPACIGEADVDPSGEPGLNVSDLTFMVNYLFSGGPEPPVCPEI